MRKKMIEVAIPLDAINKESAREKSIRHGHPSTLHLWWARRPLAACRAVIFTSLVDDPDSDPANRNSDGAVDVEKAHARRMDLFQLIEELVKWENSTNEDVLNRAKAEIAASLASAKVHDSREWTRDELRCGTLVGEYLSRTAPSESVDRLLQTHLPPALDPFAGGGSIPLEAQRLGLRVFAGDLNPVPILINKALIELPPQFSGKPPLRSRESSGPDASRRNGTGQKTFVDRKWKRAEGLAADVRHYGNIVRDEVARRIGHLYPKVIVSPEMAKGRPDLNGFIGQELTIIAWLWSRTVVCPNPACRTYVPLMKSFALCSKSKRPLRLVPGNAPKNGRVHFAIEPGLSQTGQGTISRKGAKCIACETPIPFSLIRTRGRDGELGEQLLALICDGPAGRVYLSATPEHEELPTSATPTWRPDIAIPHNPFSLRPPLYGLSQFSDLFTNRQLAALSCFAEVLDELSRTLPTEVPADYARAIHTLLALSVSRVANRCSSACFWDPVGENVQQVFGRQALAMAWDFVEGNPLSTSSGNFVGQVEYLTNAVETCPASASGHAVQHDAALSYSDLGPEFLICTDPPYYDNIDYADLSDFFYVWLRRLLADVYPNLLKTVLTPKAEELVATPYRHDGDKSKARAFFESGLGKAISQMRQSQTAQAPLTLFYAFKQAETEEVADETTARDFVTASTGWETMLEGVVGAGFSISGTWPMRTELVGNLKKQMSALASSIVLVCRPREASAPMTSRREFVNALKRELPAALKDLQKGNIAPVDLAQAAIGPGMAVYSRYSKVLESSGERLTVRTALALINQVLDEVLAEQEGDYDADTRWSLKWFEQFAHEDGPFGDANTLATAMSIGINGLVETGIVRAKAGKVRLLKRTELMNGHPETWDPATDTDIVHWEVCQYLVHALDTKGEAGAAALMRRINARYPGAAETARELAYRLYTICERKKWAQEAIAYNSLIVAWPEIVKLAQSSDGSGGEAQTTMF